MVPGRHFCEARDLIRQFEAGALDEVPFRFNRVTEIVKNCLGIQISSSVSHSCYCCRIMTLYLTCLKHTVRCLPWKIPLVYILVVDSEIFKQFLTLSKFLCSCSWCDRLRGQKVASCINVATPRDTCHKAR